MDHSKLFDLLALCISKGFNFTYNANVNTLHITKYRKDPTVPYGYFCEYGDIANSDYDYAYVRLDSPDADAKVQRVLDEVAAWSYPTH